MAKASKESQLIESIVALADEQLGGERSKTARWLFHDIAKECGKLGYTKLERIAQTVSDHFNYD
jgi:HPt (histidine-containing phosphotransfer) domain-containing protein